MGDQLFLLPPISLERVGCAYQGYRFTIDVYEVKRLFGELILQYEGVERGKHILLDATSLGDLRIYIQEEDLLPKLRGVWGTEILMPSDGLCEHYGWGVEITIALRGLINHQTRPREFFTNILAHELRHWFQRSKYFYLKDHIKSTLKMKFFHLLSWCLEPLGVFSVWGILFAIISGFLFSQKFVFFSYLILVFGMVFALNAKLMQKKPNYLFKFKHKIDRLVWKLKYYNLEPAEIDARNFALFAVKDERWLNIVTIEKMDD